MQWPPPPSPPLSSPSSKAKRPLGALPLPPLLFLLPPLFGVVGWEKGGDVIDTNFHGYVNPAAVALAWRGRERAFFLSRR